MRVGGGIVLCRYGFLYSIAIGCTFLKDAGLCTFNCCELSPENTRGKEV